MNENAAVSPVSGQGLQPSWFENKCRAALFHRLANLKGTPVIKDGQQTLTLGSGEGARAQLTVRSPDFYTDLALRGSLGAAQGWMMGNWDSEDLTGLIALFARNPDLTDGLIRAGRGLLRAARPFFTDGTATRWTAVGGISRNTMILETSFSSCSSTRR